MNFGQTVERWHSDVLWNYKFMISTDMVDCCISFFIYFSAFFYGITADGLIRGVSKEGVDFVRVVQEVQNDHIVSFVHW